MSGKRGIRVLRVATLLVAAVCTHLAISSAGAPVTAQKSARRGVSRAAVDVKGIFKERCAKCHGSDGRANTVMGETSLAPNFTDRGWQRGVSDRRMMNSITNGREGMPAFKNSLSQKQIKALVAYVRTFDKGVDAP
jgi:cbb3-type cytochrome c oxidase subunit III